MVDPTPKVSVIIPCYNQGCYLEDAVRSALAQTYLDLEVIVVDDGSTDPETQALLRHFEQPRVLVLQIAHQGPSVARNIGIEEARGEFILPLDSDDWIAPEYVEQAVQILERQPETGIVYCKAELVQDGRHYHWELPDYAFPQMLLVNSIFSSGMFRKTAWEEVGGYNTSMVEGWEDYDFWLSLIERGAKVKQIPRVLFYYRRHEHSRSASRTTVVAKRLSRQLLQNHQHLYEENLDELVWYARELQAKAELSRHSRNQLYQSRSWQITRPLRAAAKVAAAIRRKISGQ